MRDRTENIKDRIILAVFEYIETNNDSFKLEAQDQLKVLAKRYRINIKNVPKIELKASFKQFVSNNNGYIVTINELYHSL